MTLDELLENLGSWAGDDKRHVVATNGKTSERFEIEDISQDSDGVLNIIFSDRSAGTMPEPEDDD